MNYDLYAEALDYLNNNIVPGNLVEQNLYNTLNLQLEKYLADDENFSPEETDMLTNIAFMTPMEGGPGVFNARAMLNLEVNDPELNLRMANPEQIIVKEAAFICPNPTNGILQLKNAEKSFITVNDASGRILISTKSKQILDLTDFENGLYYITIIQSNGETTHDKIILAKQVK